MFKDPYINMFKDPYIDMFKDPYINMFKDSYINMFKDPYINMFEAKHWKGRDVVHVALKGDVVLPLSVRDQMHRAGCYALCCLYLSGTRCTGLGVMCGEKHLV
jgi:hypothetical protein